MPKQLKYIENAKKQRPEGKLLSGLCTLLNLKDVGYQDLLGATAEFGAHPK